MSVAAGSMAAVARRKPWVRIRVHRVQLGPPHHVRGLGAVDAISTRRERRHSPRVEAVQDGRCKSGDSWARSHRGRNGRAAVGRARLGPPRRRSRQAMMISSGEGGRSGPFRERAQRAARFGRMTRQGFLFNNAAGLAALDRSGHRRYAGP